MVDMSDLRPFRHGRRYRRSGQVGLAVSLLALSILSGKKQQVDAFVPKWPCGLSSFCRGSAASARVFQCSRRGAPCSRGSALMDVEVAHEVPMTPQSLATDRNGASDFMHDLFGLPPDVVAFRPPPGKGFEARLLTAAVEGVGGVTQDDTATDDPFVDMFRHSAPYIDMHRGAVMVLHVPGEMVSTPVFEQTMDDVSLMSLLGVKVVIVCGIAARVDRRLRECGLSPMYCGEVRVTDAEALRVIKEEAGYARCEVESALSRGFKGRPGAMGINVVGGNMFFSAKPYGVIGGVDFGFTGEVRKVERGEIDKRLDQGDVVLLTAVGYSASGQVFNVMSEQLASETAAALHADKLIFMTQGQTLVDKRTDRIIHGMRLSDAKALLDYNGIQLFSSSTVVDECLIDGVPVLTDKRTSANSDEASMMRFCRFSVQALLKGVRRAHLVPSGNGRLLQELYNRDGCGTLISRDMYDDIRAASGADVPGIMDIIEPLMTEGTLTPKSRDEVEKSIGQYYVFTRDNLIVACGQLSRWGDFAEIACLAVHPHYRRGSRGDAMLGYLERIAVNSGVSNIFVLSTRSMQWLLERGFSEVSVQALPPDRVSVYDWKRRSKIYLKQLKTQRDVEEEESFMRIQ